MAIVPQKLRTIRAWSRRLSRLLGLPPRRFAGVGALAVVNGLVESATLLLLVQIATGVAAGKDEVHVHVSPFPAVSASIPELLGAAFLLAIVRSLVQYLTGRAIATLGADSMRNLRRRAMHAYFAASWDVQAAERQSELVELVASQSMQVATSVTTLLTGLTQSLRLVVMITAAVVIAPIGAVTIIVGALVIFVVIRPMTKRVKEHARLRLESSLSFSRTLHETSSIMSEVRVFGVTGPVRDRLDGSIDEVADHWRTGEIYHRLLPSFYQLLAMTLLLATLGVLYQMDSGATSMGAVVLIMVRAMAGSQGLQGTYNKLYELTPFVDLVSKRLKRYEASVEARGEEAIPVIERLSFDDVSFAYREGVWALRGVSFDVTHGEAIGVVGPSGAGKSTLVQLLLGLRHATEGTYRVNGRDAFDYRADDWFADLAIVPQEPHMIEGTVADNIRFFRTELTDEDVERAARQANVHDDIVSWADGYETWVGERGGTLSGGQRQRLSLARALAGRPSMLVLDEPTSALDMRSESLVRDSINALKGSVTVFIVAHRLSTLNLCDRIMVFADGRLESFGPAPEVEASNAFYQEALALSRLP